MLCERQSGAGEKNVHPGGKAICTPWARPLGVAGPGACALPIHGVTA